ncbi:hypothetical protein TL16_g06894 [Triparma laevis f. inornata]|uniref:alpha-1,3-mannosyl-glycoprotein 2-beta-N-acetylglucosaminyltransferase n=1 Tax=Triparma laevis f. inornata TaxID=1714386 RepID=A0A9W7EEI6_9STRA|nr:hypothetical protein TL16_g06894 [Triparma laevis f. inornata]
MKGNYGRKRWSTRDWFMLASILLVFVFLTRGVRCPSAPSPLSSSSSPLPSLRGDLSTERIRVKDAEIATLKQQLAGHYTEDAAVDLGLWQKAVEERDEMLVNLHVAEAKDKATIADLQASLKNAEVVGASAKLQNKPVMGGGSSPVAVPPDRASLPPPPGEVLNLSSSSSSSFSTTTTLLIFTFKRADYLKRTLGAIYPLIPPGMKIVISQDGQDQNVITTVNEWKQKFGEKNSELTHVFHTQKAGENGYQLLSQHYGFGLKQAFELQDSERVIVLEEDIQVSVDFFKFFEQFSPMLDDPYENLMCISAWNDNGMRGYVTDSKAVVRSDFFPGLGWMLTKEMWEEWSTPPTGPWPRGYWDDWLREPERRKGRKIIRPEVSRTYHFGKSGGTSNNVYSAYLDSIVLNEVDVDWNSEDVHRLKKSNYDPSFRSRVEAARLVSSSDVRSSSDDVRVEYTSLDRGAKSFERIAKQLGIMDNIKANVPRTAYHGVVEYRIGQRRIYVSPQNIDWS